MAILTFLYVQVLRVLKLYCNDPKCAVIAQSVNRHVMCDFGPQHAAYSHAMTHTQHNEIYTYHGKLLQLHSKQNTCM